MNTKRLFQGIACAVLAFAVTAPVLARDDRGHDRGRSHHYDRRDDRGNLLMVAIATGIIADLLLHH